MGQSSEALPQGLIISAVIVASYLLMRTRFIIALSLLILAIQAATAQLATVYVDAVNGSDSFTGANPTNVPSGTGPKANIHGGLVVLADKGRLVIFAGTYAGDGIDTTRISISVL
jgi:hypothetical protein